MATIRLFADECCRNCPNYEDDEATVMCGENGRVDTLITCAKQSECDLIYVSTIMKKLEGKKCELVNNHLKKTQEVKDDYIPPKRP